MKIFYRILSIIAISCLIGFLSVRISSIFIVLLPVISITNGYFSSRRWGVLGGFLLFFGYSITLILQTYSPGRFYPLSFFRDPFIACLILSILGFMGGFVRQNSRRIRKLFWIPAITLGWFVYTAIWGYNPSIIIDDIYCSFSTTSNTPVVDLNFKLKNLQIKSNNLDYSWSLNDPMANGMHTLDWMGNPVARMFEGQGKLSLQALETKSITISIEPERNIYDPRGFVMYLSLSNGNTQIGYFGDQKSTYDWDYSVIPPIKRIEKPDYSRICINTDIEPIHDGFKATITEVIVTPTERIEGLSLDNMRVSISQKIYNYDMFVPVRLTDLIEPEYQNYYGLRYYDQDSNEMISKGDFIIMNSEAEGFLIIFESWDNPFALVENTPYPGKKIEN